MIGSTLRSPYHKTIGVLICAVPKITGMALGDVSVAKSAIPAGFGASAFLVLACVKKNVQIPILERRSRVSDVISEPLNEHGFIYPWPEGIIISRDIPSVIEVSP